jgi:MFS family permease
MKRDNLLNLDFFSVCTVTFLAICNVSVFYNFHLYLQSLGFHGKESGFLIGLYSLTAMILYLAASKHITLDNAFGCILIGVLTVAGCGVAYLYAKSFWPLVILRIVNGAGVFLVMASCMVFLVSIIPPDKTGLAFSLYSVALLLPYSIMPALSEIVLPFLGSPTKVYLLTASLLLPAAGIIPVMRNRISGRYSVADPKNDETPDRGGERKNLFRKPVISILMVNGVYFIIFAALFFLFEGFAIQRGFNNPGFFFTTQMGVMILIRLFGGQIFDKFSKVALVFCALMLTSAGFGLLLSVPDSGWFFPIAAVFGLGMGLCVPPLNSLMYLVTKPRYRGYNANMMMLSVHFGNFAGPFVGAWIIDAGGYDRFLFASILISTSAAVFFLFANPAKYVR